MDPPPVPYRPSLSTLARALGALLTILLGGDVERAGEIPVGEPALRAHEKVRLVLLAVTVTTAKGKPVTGLTEEDFRLFDDGRSQEIEFFGTESNLPVSVAFVLDVSGSMGLGTKLGRAKEAVGEFIEGLDRGDRAGMICFADEQVRWVTRFTDDFELLERRLAVQEAYGPTALYDALAATVGMVDDAVQGRRAIVLLTDGLDNASDLSTLEAMWVARRVQVPIYVLDFVSSDPVRLRQRDRENVEVLTRFADETGGAVWPVHDEEQLDRAVERTLAELRFQYMLGFSAARGEPRFHPVRVDVARAGLKTRTRAGYYVEP